MANELKTINDYTELASPAADDYITIWDTSTGQTFKISREDLVGAIISGGFTLAVNANSVIAGQLLGSGVVDTNGFTLNVDGDSTINGSLDGEGFTLTVPATGTAALLARQQSFTQQQTVAPTEAGDDGVIANMPSGTTNGVAFRAQFNGTSRAYIQQTSALNQFVMAAFDNGAGVGCLVIVDRNNNGSTAAPGAVLFRQADGGNSFVWSDNSEIMRVAATQPTSGGITGGTVIGSQSSAADAKHLEAEYTDFEAALRLILDTPLYLFGYKEKWEGEKFVGLVTDYSPEFGLDRDEEHPNGKILNEVSAHGYQMAAIKALNQKIADLEALVVSLVGSK